MADRYSIAAETVGYKPLGLSALRTLVTDATLAYADTNVHLFTLATENPIIEYFKTYGLLIKVTYQTNPNDVNLTIGSLSLPEANTTPLTAATLVESTAWDSKVIDLNTSGGTNVEYYFLDDIIIRGNYIYLKYQYSGDPGNDPKVEIKLVEV